LNIVWLQVGQRTRITQLEYIAEENPIAAFRLDEEIERQVRQLSEHPMMGRSGRQPGTRELVISRTPFIAIYRVTNARIEILRILDGAQQWPRRPGRGQPDQPK
jgi:toxin ParE1/3/4